MIMPNSKSSRDSFASALDPSLPPEGYHKQNKREGGRNPFRPKDLKAIHEGERRGEGVPAWRRRWAHVHSPVALMTYETANVAQWKEDEGVNWTSITTPAVLPVTTGGSRDAIKKELDRVHTKPDGTTGTLYERKTQTYYDLADKYSSVHELLIELVCQRLLHDFQIVEFDDDPLRTASRTTSSRFMSELMTPRTKPRQRDYYLSKGRHYHQLEVNPESTGVLVTTYEWDPELAKRKFGDPLVYRYHVWHEHERNYAPRRAEFEAGNSSVRWNNLDECIQDSGLLAEHGRFREKLVPLLKPTAKRYSLVERNRPSGARDDERKRNPSAELLRIDSSKSAASDSSAASELSGPILSSSSASSVVGEKVRASFSAFINAVDELANMNVQIVGPAEDGEAGELEGLPEHKRTLLDVSKSAGGKQAAHEWGWCIHDKRYDPRRAWRLEVCWVSWAGVKVAEFLQRLASRARAHGFLLVEMPLDGDAVGGDRGNALSAGSYSLVCATVFIRRLAEEKLGFPAATSSHSPLAHPQQLLARWPGFHYDRRLPRTMDSGGEQDEEAWRSSEIMQEFGTPSSWGGLRSSGRSQSMFDLSRTAEDWQDHAPVVGARQRLCLAQLLTGRLSPPACSVLRALVLQGDDSVLERIHTHLPHACADDEVVKRAAKEILHLHVVPGAGYAREERLVGESMPMQFVHESGGALLGVGRCGSGGASSRTLCWTALPTGGGEMGGSRPAGTSGAAATALAARGALEEWVDGANFCAALVAEMVQAALPQSEPEVKL